MDILFILPIYTKDRKYDIVGTYLLSTLLVQNNISSKILYYFQEDFLNKPFNKFIIDYTDLILSYKPKIVSLYLIADSTYIQLRLAQELKAKDPTLTIISGGPQATLLQEKLLQFSADIDYICCGEGETTIVPLCSSILEGRVDLTIPGLAYRSAKEFKVNPQAELLPSNYQLPLDIYIASDLLVDAKYINENNISIGFDVGRGCIGRCAFCSSEEV